MNRRRLKLVILIASIILANSSCQSSRTVEYSFDPIVNAKLLQKKSFFPFSFADDSNQKITFQNSIGEISVRSLDFTQKAFFNSKEREMFFLRSAYQKSVPPYVGAIKVKEECPERFLPHVFEEIHDSNKSLFGFAARGTERGRYGACEESAAKITFVKTILECKKQKKLFEIVLSFDDPHMDHSILSELYLAFNCI
jgi:hypothetical protein